MIQNTSIFQGIVVVFANSINMHKASLVLKLLVISLNLCLCLAADEEALLGLKEKIAPTSPATLLVSNWSASTNFCSWIGVSCTKRHRRATALTLTNMNLNGTISPLVGNLSFLVSLDLSNNNLHGGLPPELSKLWRLKSINLMNNHLSGRVPAGIGYLSRLQVLYLNGNQLLGSIPLPIFNMSSLQRLVLANNNFSGTIPMDFCDQLPLIQLFEISFNNISGIVSPNLYKCKLLQVLGLSNNRFEGRIPRELGNLTRLKELYLGFNDLEGDIPVELSKLVRLERFAVESNRLTGSVPYAMFNLSYLKDLVLMNNSIHGHLPEDLCHHQPKLEKLFLYNNMFVGRLPRDIGNCSMLKQLRLGRNNFTGVLPEEIGHLEHLEFLRLPSNNLEGPLPAGIFNMSKIMDIALAANHFSGNLPHDMGQWLPNLLVLSLGGNRINGIIPSSISNASQIGLLELSENLLTGTIPKALGNLEFLLVLGLAENAFSNDPSTHELNFLESLTNCRHLMKLGISNNPLNGMLPLSIANFSNSVEMIDASNCRIYGKIPFGINNLSRLNALSLSDNNLTGSISFKNLTKLQRLHLSGNMIQGHIPNDLCQLKNLGELFLSHNRFSGTIPTCFGTLLSLRILLLDHNNLTSEIPSTLWSLSYLLVLNLSSNLLSGSLAAEIGNLKVLASLDLSRNQFSGNITDAIGSFPDLTSLSLAHNKLQGQITESLSKLVSLEYLDLSDNNLSGFIPKSLERLSFLKYFNVSFNKLEGEIPNGGPFQNFSSQSYLNNYALCGASRLQVPACRSKTTTHPHWERTTAGIVLRFILPLLAAMTVVSVIIVLFLRRKKRTTMMQREDSSVLQAFRRVTYHELLHATDSFSEANLLGYGSFGSVYKGTLSDQMLVAIKVFNTQSEEAFESFHTECEVLRTIRHRNLIKILTSCCRPDFRALVLEFMPNGSLDKWLYSHNYFLDISQRLAIMIDVALALEHLHYGHSPPVVHCDLKPSNILLDTSMVARVSDFGMSKLLGGNSFTRTMTLATIGYLAPEYGSTGVVSTRADVYSYGIVLMETFTRTKPTDQMFVGEISLRSWVKESVYHGITTIADANLLKEDEKHFIAKAKCIGSIMKLALECCAESPDNRRNMKDVVSTLKKIQNEFLNTLGKA